MKKEGRRAEERGEGRGEERRGGGKSKNRSCLHPSVISDS